MGRGAAACGTVTLFCALSLVLSMAPASAQGSPYRLDAAVDGSTFGIALALSLPAFLEVPPPACLPDACDPMDVNAFDRQVIGNYSESTRRASDYAMIGVLALPLIVNAVDSGGDGWLTDTAIYAESLLVTQALVQLTKHAFRRSAPFVYDPDVPLDVRMNDPDGARSFISGHSATAFAAGATATFTFWERNPDSDWRWAVLGVSAVAAATVAVMKVEAGYHHWTDVIAGALVGTSVGILVPLLHLD